MPEQFPRGRRLRVVPARHAAARRRQPRGRGHPARPRRRRPSRSRAASSRRWPGRSTTPAGTSEAVDSFTRLIAVNPTDDYAQFGLGLAASRAGELRLAAEHLALAVAMRPEPGHYARALRGVRARQAAESA